MSAIANPSRYRTLRGEWLESRSLLATLTGDSLSDSVDETDGDWNCDGEFDTRDLVAAFQDGGYVSAAKVA
jgi:hypothetical protein